MKKILFLGSSFGVVEMIRYCKNHEIYTIVTDYLEEYQSRAKQLADEYWMISTADLKQLEEKCKIEKITGIMCGESEFNLDKLIELCERMRLPCYCTREQREYSKNKIKFKELCNKLGINTPNVFTKKEILEKSRENSISVVVKPNGCSGSVGVSFCENFIEVDDALRLAERKSKIPGIIVERKLEGREFFAVYCFAEGSSSLITFNEMHAMQGYPTKCYSLVTSYTDEIERYILEMHPSVCELFREINIVDGMAWVQTILDKDNKFYLIEMGREGRLPDMKSITGFDFSGWQVSVALGTKHKREELPVSQHINYKGCACEYILWTKIGGVVKKIVFDHKKIIDYEIDAELLIEEGSEVEQYRIVGHALFYVNNEKQMLEKIKVFNTAVNILNEKNQNMLIKIEGKEICRMNCTNV